MLQNMTVKELEGRLLNTENPMTLALDLLHGEGNWTENEADELCNAFLGAIAQAHEDRAADVEFMEIEGKESS